MALALQRENIQPIMLVLCITSLRSPVKRLSKQWLLLEGMKAFKFVRNVSGFNLYTFLEKQRDFIQPLVNEVFKSF